MSAVPTLDMIGSARPLARCGMAELAVHTTTARPSGGILFARGQERGHKDEARRYVIDLLGDAHHVCEYQDTGSPMYQVTITKP